MNKLILAIILLSGLSSLGALSGRDLLEQKLLETVRRDWPRATKTQVTNFKLHRPAPKNSVLISLQPRPLLGAVSFEVAWDKKGKNQKTFGSAIVMVETPVAVATRDIRPGEELSEGNMNWISKEVSRFSHNSSLSDPQEVEGKIARSFIRSGSNIQLSQIEAPVEIQRGQRVDLTFENSQLKISAKMKALERGRTGDWIRVENEKTKRVVRSKVVGPGRVSLN